MVYVGLEWVQRGSSRSLSGKGKWGERGRASLLLLRLRLNLRTSEEWTEMLERLVGL